MRYTCPIRDRVGKAVGRLLRQCQCVKYLAATGNSRPGGQNCCAVACPLRPAKWQVGKGGSRRRGESYSIHVADWHAPHPLMREYVTVLHAHRSEPSLTVGPRYSCPDRRGLIINAARDETATPIHAKRTLTTPMTRGLQVCRDFTRILIEGVI